MKSVLNSLSKLDLGTTVKPEINRDGDDFCITDFVGGVTKNGTQFLSLQMVNREGIEHGEQIFKDKSGKWMTWKLSPILNAFSQKFSLNTDKAVEIIPAIIGKCCRIVWVGEKGEKYMNWDIKSCVVIDTFKPNTLAAVVEEDDPFA